MWPDLIQKAKDGGLDVIQTYVFWNGHEPSPGKVLVLMHFNLFLILNIVLFYRLRKCSLAFPCFEIFSIILRIGMIWLSSSSWYNKQAYMSISELGPMFVLNGTLGNNVDNICAILTKSFNPKKISTTQKKKKRNWNSIVFHMFCFCSVSDAGDFLFGWNMFQALLLEQTMNLSRLELWIPHCEILFFLTFLTYSLNY